MEDNFFDIYMAFVTLIDFVEVGQCPKVVKKEADYLGRD